MATMLSQTCLNVKFARTLPVLFFH